MMTEAQYRNMSNAELVREVEHQLSTGEVDFNIIEEMKERLCSKRDS